MLRLQLLLVVFFLQLITFSLGALTCPSGFSLTSGSTKCAKVIRNSLKHGLAEADCRYLGGTLFNVKNAIDNRALSTLAAAAGISNVWMGLYCFNNSTSGCYLDDGSGTAAVYSNFVPGHPQTAGGYGGCVYMTTSNGQWVSAKCEVVGFPFVCEVPATYSDSCPHNYNGFCYYPSHEFPKHSQNLTHSKAKSYCESINTTLASVHSIREIDLIKTIFRDSYVFQAFLGAKASLPEVFNWADGTQWDFDYSNPLNKTQANCMVMDTQGAGLWSQVNCQTVNYFLCKRPAGASSSTSGAEDSAQKAVHVPVSIDVSDFSNCNTTFLLAPGVITSPNYPSNFPETSYCSYTLTTLGPYRVGMYFSDINLGYNYVYIYDSDGTQLANWYYTQYPTSIVATGNTATVVFQANRQNPAHGFEATILPV